MMNDLEHLLFRFLLNRDVGAIHQVHIKHMKKYKSNQHHHFVEWRTEDSKLLCDFKQPPLSKFDQILIRWVKI
jgi:hypothetical protein